MPSGHAAATGLTARTIWTRILSEATTAAGIDPALASILELSVIRHQTLESALCFRLADLIAERSVPAQALRHVFECILDGDSSVLSRVGLDIAAVLERDPATCRALHVLLYLKGFHAIQIHRFANALWHDGRCDLARYFQSRSSEVFQVDIHPAVELGTGIFFDHATGIVIGETAVVEDDVPLLQNVTLGGTGTETGDRHPKIRSGVLIGAGATVLGNIEIGANARIGASSVVLEPIDPMTTVVGIPARVTSAVSVKGSWRAPEQMRHVVDLLGRHVLTVPNEVEADHDH